MKQIILTSFLVLSMAGAMACSCSYMGPFLQMTKNAQLVALVKVSRYNNFVTRQDSTKMPLSMEAEIIEVYQGIEQRRTVTIWGDNGMLCRPYISTFTEGRYYVIALNKITNTRRSINEKDDDYAISICGAYWLNVDPEQTSATGNIDSKDGKASTILLKHLKLRIQEKMPVTSMGKAILFNKRTLQSLISPPVY